MIATCGVEVFVYDGRGEDLGLSRAGFVDNIKEGDIRIKVSVPDQISRSIRLNNHVIAVRVMVNRIGVGGTQPFEITDHCFVVQDGDLVIDEFVGGPMAGQKITPMAGLTHGTKRFRITIEVGLARKPVWTQRHFYVPIRGFDLESIKLEGQIA